MDTRISRRALLASLGAIGLVAAVPKPVKRYWQLDRTMVEPEPTYDDFLAAYPSMQDISMLRSMRLINWDTAAEMIGLSREEIAVYHAMCFVTGTPPETPAPPSPFDWDRPYEELLAHGPRVKPIIL